MPDQIPFPDRTAEDPTLTALGTKRKIKRKVFYSQEYVERAEKLARMGAFDYEIAAQLGADVGTLGRWKKVYPEFREALERGKLDADMQVTASLFRRAVGGTCRAVKVLLDKGEPVTVSYEKEVLPDVRACIWWLRNRRPEVWKENVVLTTELRPGVPEMLTPEQEATLRRIARIRAEGEADCGLFEGGGGSSASGQGVCSGGL